MMMITGRETFHSNPTVQVPPWDNDPTDHTHNNNIHTHSPLFLDDLEMSQYDDVSEYYNDDIININDAFASDHFRMYEFKIRRCSRARSHDWTECPYAHPGEKARRRDPRKIIYSGNPCPDFRKGACFRGDTCEYAHGVFECWLHPSRYRTQPCKDGVLCRRRICFFAHTPEQIRSVFGQNGQNGSTHLTHLTHGSTHLTVLGQLTELTQCDSFDGSPSRYSLDSFVGMGNGLFGSSPTSTLFPASGSPPMSPVGQTSVNELTTTIRNMHIGNGHNGGNGLRMNGGGCFSTRSLSMLRPGYNSLPSTPTRNPARVNGNVFDNWEQEVISEEPVMERVESGKGIRAMMYAKLSRENSLVERVGRGGRGGLGESGQDDGWVSELVN